MLYSVNPATGERRKSFPEDTDQQIEEKLRKAEEARFLWREVPISVRAEALKKLANHLRQDQETFARLITEEMGKPIRQARAEVEKCAWVCEFYAENAEQWLQPRKTPTEAQDSGVIYEPLGIILGIMPWNFPFWQVFRFAVPTLMAGNVVLLKHASSVPECALTLERLFQEVLPVREAFQWLALGSGSRIFRRVLQDRRIRGVSLTGSTEAGKRVAQVAGERLIPAVMELGGSDPFVVLADAPLRQAVETAVFARLQNNGQSCIASKRFLIHEVVGEKFVKMLIERLESVRIGDPMDEETDVGPLAREDICRDLERQLHASIQRGARIRWQMDSSRLPSQGFYFPVTVVDGVKPGMPVFDEETFGPLFAISVAEESLLRKLANETRYGLGASVWTTSSRKAREWIHALDCGMVFVNALVRSDPRLPFGGVRESGFGRELAREGLLAFVNIKTYWVET